MKSRNRARSSGGPGSSTTSANKSARHAGTGIGANHLCRSADEWDASTFKHGRLDEGQDHDLRDRRSRAELSLRGSGSGRPLPARSHRTVVWSPSTSAACSRRRPDPSVRGASLRQGDPCTPVQRRTVWALVAAQGIEITSRAAARTSD